MSKLIIFTAPSGAGKTTIVRHLLTKYDELAFSVSATTRKKRPHEEEGVHYYFHSVDQFLKKVKDEDFLEWEEVYEGQYYGTLDSEITRLWNAGKHIIFDIDVHGARDIKNAYPDDTLAVFIKPPSPEVLFERLRNRKTEDEKSLQKRIKRAAKELAFEDKFDTILLNDDLELALKTAENILESFLGIKQKQS